MNWCPRIRGLLIFLFTLIIRDAMAQNTELTPENNFPVPMYFETKDGSVVAQPPEVEYELSEGNVLRIGNVKLTEKNFLVANRTLAQVFPQAKVALSSKELGQNYFLVKWPTTLFSTGIIEMITREGKVIWRYDVTEMSLKKWQQLQESWRQRLIEKGVNSEAIKSPIFQMQLAINMNRVKIPIEGQLAYRFCFTQKKGRASSKLCSRRYSSKKQGNQTLIAKIVSDVKARVLLQNEEVPLKGDVPVSTEMPTSFYAELASGESYEFIAQALAPALMDISWNEDSNTYQIVGSDPVPYNDVQILNPENSSRLVEAIGFESTIKDERKFWAAQVSKDKPELYFPGNGAGLFHQKFTMSDIPSARLRPFLGRRTLPGTYVDGAFLSGQRIPDIQVSTEQNSVEIDDKDPSLFYWKFGSKEKGEINRSYLTVSSQTQTARAYYELYRGYSNELSGRFSGILSAGQGLVMGEIAYNHWFENVFGWENYYLAKQRWGISYRNFMSLNQIPVDQDGNKAGLGATNLDLKYRFTPGLWTREESAGLMLDYQRVTFNPLHATMLGVGWFWARSMPRVFDAIFSLLPFMDYQKWVDMELIYYVGTTEPTIRLNTNFAVNFHGQVLWKKWFFGEAGFGMKRYAFIDDVLQQKAELNTFYGTVGLGFKF